MIVTAIDPGSTKSGLVQWDGKQVLMATICSNEDVLHGIDEFVEETQGPSVVAIEQVRGFGLKAGNELFDAIWWSGRMYETCQLMVGACHMIPRKTVVTHLCNTAKGGDKDVRDALIYRFGSPGNKKERGLLYGVAGDMWSALALAVYVVDTQETFKWDAQNKCLTNS